MSNNQFLDAKTIPKFQFQLLDQQLTNCIKQLYLQSKSQQKIISSHKKQLQQKININSYLDSLKYLENNIQLPSILLNLLSPSIKNKDYNDPSNPILTNTIKLSNKFSIFTQIIVSMNNKISTIQQKVNKSQEKINLNVKQKVSSLQQQLTSFIKDYRSNFKDLNNKFQQSKILFQNKAKQIQTTTLWKINECSKRLQDRPNVQMVKNSISQMQLKLSKMIQSDKGLSKTNSFNNDTTKLQQEIIKIKKLVDFNNIQLQSQIKSINEKLELKYLSLKSYGEQKLQITKRFENINISNADLNRKINSHQSQLQTFNDTLNKLTKLSNNHDQQIIKINSSIQKFTKNDQFARLLQKIDPHQLCRISSIVQSLQLKSISTDQRIQSLNIFSQALRSKMEFWNKAQGQNPQKPLQQFNIQLITKIVKDEISSSDFKIRILKIQQQLIELISLKQGINDILKKIGKINKDNDLTNIKYEIQGVQQYIKREILIMSNKLITIQNLINNSKDLKKRPLSGREKDDKMFVSLSTKKLLPVNCISCHQTNNLMVQRQRQRKTVFNSKFVTK